MARVSLAYWGRQQVVLTLRLVGDRKMDMHIHSTSQYWLFRQSLSYLYNSLRIQEGLYRISAHLPVHVQRRDTRKEGGVPIRVPYAGLDTALPLINTR